jgi:hypothetical protein
MCGCQCLITLAILLVFPSPRRLLRTEPPPGDGVRHNLKPHFMDADCPRRRDAIHRSQQRRNPFPLNLGADASHQYAPSALAVLVEMVDLESENRLLHRRLFLTTLDAEDDVVSGHRVVDRHGDRSEVILVHESPDFCGSQQPEAFVGREVFELALRHGAILALTRRPLLGGLALVGAEGRQSRQRHRPLLRAAAPHLSFSLTKTSLNYAKLFKTA